MIYAQLDASGFPVGFYMVGINEIPEGAVEITAEDHRAFLSEPGKWIWNKGRQAAPPPAPPSAQEIAARASADAMRQLAASDYKMARAVEDLIGILVRKGVFSEADMPAQVRAEIAARQTLRAKL